MFVCLMEQESTELAVNVSYKKYKRQDRNKHVKSVNNPEDFSQHSLAHLHCLSSPDRLCFHRVQVFFPSAALYF